MKTLLMTFTTLMSATAMAACPTYNGTYLCKNDSMEQTLNLKTEVVNGQYQYSLDTTTVIADGAVRPIDFQGGIYDIAASCTADKVTVQVKFPGGEGDNEACGTEKWDLFYTLNFSPNGSNITESHFSNAVCASGAVIPSGDEATMDCVAL